EVRLDPHQADRVVRRRDDRQAEVDRMEQRILLDLWQDHAPPRPAGAGVVATGQRVRTGRLGTDVTRGEDADGVVVTVQGDAHLLQVVDALRAPGRLACRLHGGQEQG